MNKKISCLLFSVSLGTLLPGAGAEDPWRFIGFADWHTAEKYVSVWESAWTGAGFDSYAAYRADRQAGDIAKLTTVQNTFGGELVVIAGDTQGGNWDSTSFQTNFKTVAEYANYSTSEVIIEAGHFCYSGMQEAFATAGYPQMLVAIGDHEVGDNNWGVGAEVSIQQPAFREGFADILNRDDQGDLLYTDPIGTADSRPYGTAFEETSYAMQHKNVLFVTVDVFYQQSPTVSIGPNGTVKGVVTGDHLTWLIDVLSQAANIPSIKHIIVQAHLPGIYPVRKFASSGMLLMDNENSDFFNAMRQYGVDLYLAGEVHANTMTIDPSSDLVQLVTRGVVGSNVTVFDVEDDRIYIETYKGQTDSTLLGTVEIDKSGGGAVTHGTGVFEAIDPRGLQLHYSFDQSVDEDDIVTSASNSRNVNSTCDRAFENDGGFGVDYVAFAKNCPIDPQGVVGGAVSVGASTEMGITSQGPLMEGYERSVACWVKTTSSARQMLFDCSLYGGAQFFNLSLNDGLFEVILKNGVMKTSNTTPVNDGLWHHVAVATPWKDATVADLRLFIDGVEQTNTTVQGGSTVVNTNQNNKPVIGNLYAASGVNMAGLFGLERFIGSMDEMCLWTRGLSTIEIKALVDGAANRGYDAVYMEALFNLYHAGAGTADVQGATWTYDPTLVGTAGVFVQTGNAISLVLGAQGGVRAVDNEAPTPNPAEFLLSPTATSPVRVEMTAVAASDVSGGVEYFFSEVSGNYGGTSSSWQPSTSYVDEGLLPDTSYAYTVTTRDSLGHVGTAGAIVSVTTPAVVFPQSGMIAAWHTPDSTSQGAGVNDSSPDVVLAGVSASVSGGRDGWTGFNSTDGTYGTLATPAVPGTAGNAIRVRNATAEKQVDLVLANNTGGDLELNSVHFDFGGYDAGPKTVELFYLSGDLEDADNTSIDTATRLSGSIHIADYQDFDMALSPALSDVVLGDGESLVLRFLFSNSNGASSASGIDNIALIGTVDNIDSDGDGIPDSVEQQHSPILDASDPADAVLDEDADGFSNSQEILSGTDLTRASSYFQIVAATSGGFSIEIPEVVEGRVYALEYSLDLADDWKAIDALSAEGAHDGLPYQFYPATSESQGFYRIRALYAP